MKNRIIAVFLAVFIGMSVTACSGKNETQEVNRVSVSGILPETGDVIVTNTYIGTVAPKESIIVYPMVSGNVTAVSAVVGQQVKTGDVLFKLDSKEVELEIAEAEANLEKMEKLAEQAKEDAEALEEALEKVEDAEKKAELEAELKTLNAELKTAQAKRDSAKTEYNQLLTEYNKYKNRDTWTTTEKKAKQETLAYAKELYDIAEADVDEIEAEIDDVEAEIKAAGSSTKSTSTKKTDSKDSDDKETDSKETDSKETDSKDSDSKTSDSTTTDNTVYEQMVEDAEKAVEDAKAKLELYQVTAPIDGTIEAVYLETNEKAFEDAPCVVLSNKSNIEVTFQVAEAAALELKTGDKVKVEKNGAMNEATITEVAIMADEQTKLFTVKASLGAVTGFSTGTDVKIYAETEKALEVMRLPYDTLYFQGDAAYVYCVVDEEAVRRPVQVGLMNEEYAQILDGLTEEDIVISTWSSQLKDGADVDLLFVIGGNTVDVTTESTEEDVNESSEDLMVQDTEADDTEEEYEWALPDLD